MNCKDIQCLPRDTKCHDCKYMVSRIIEPIIEVPEDLIDDMDEFEDSDMNRPTLVIDIMSDLVEVGEGKFIHVICTELGTELHDHKVIDCNKYQKSTVGLLSTDRFQK